MLVDWEDGIRGVNGVMWFRARSFWMLGVVGDTRHGGHLLVQWLLHVLRQLWRILGELVLIQIILGHCFNGWKRELLALVMGWK